MLARLYNAAGVISHTLQDFEKAEYYHRQALKLWQVEDDKGGIARALIDRGFQSWYEVKLAEAFEYAQASLVAARTTNNKKLVGEALILGAASAIELDKLTLARTVLDESMEIWQELGDKPGQLSTLNGYIRLEYLQGQRQKAKLYLEKALRLAAELEDYMGIIGVLVNMLYFSISAADKGKGARLAARVMGAMASWEERVNGRKWAWSLQRLGEFEQQIKEVVGEAVLADEFNIGRTLTMSEMLALGFEIAQLVELEQSSKPIAKSFQKSNHNHLLAVQPFHLTRRELEVLRLVALGRSNQEVAEELVISHRTVEAHLRSIFDKLEVSNRSAAIHFALEYGLVKLGS
jgi:DNA-binding CsgD family transcriptional regulator/tetratricopeptide (TPR) repeat protein